MARRLIALVVVTVGMAVAGCAGTPPEENVRPVTLPLPTPAIAGREVAVFPVTLVASDPRLGWDEAIGPRDMAKQRADSVLAEFLLERAPEIDWVLPVALRKAAAQAPGVLTDPDRMGTALLRAPGIDQIPDPLRSQMRNLIGVAADRYALVPAAVSFVPTPEGTGSAEITLTLADARFGIITWYTVAVGIGDTPWAAMWNALRPLVPDLP
jgi:hypothetical protein